MFLFSGGAGLSGLERAQLRRIERKLDRVLEHLGIAFDGDDPEDSGRWPSAIREPADQGKKIAAIKAHREVFGSTLVEAKAAVEAYMGR
jgi:hypothetical protein